MGGLSFGLLGNYCFYGIFHITSLLLHVTSLQRVKVTVVKSNIFLYFPYLRMTVFAILIVSSFLLVSKTQRLLMNFIFLLPYDENPVAVNELIATD